mmetsp:Transcript_44016/g.104600  ORF Transcript_44016/g.104600 Transcript_44016/m.104600 type:complete len:283 (-) Transcript_44016:29-877(-)
MPSRTRDRSSSASSLRCCFSSCSSEISPSRRLLASSNSSTSSAALRHFRSHSSASFSASFSFASSPLFSATSALIASRSARRVERASSSVRFSSPIAASAARAGASHPPPLNFSTFGPNRPTDPLRWVIFSSATRIRSSHRCCMALTADPTSPAIAASSSFDPAGARGVRGVVQLPLSLPSPASAMSGGSMASRKRATVGESRTAERIRSTDTPTMIPAATMSRERSCRTLFISDSSISSSLDLGARIFPPADRTVPMTPPAPARELTRGEALWRAALLGAC